MLMMKSTYFQYFLYAALVILSVEVVFLIKQNRDLKSQLEAFTTPPETLKAGDDATPIQALSSSGQDTLISYSGSNREVMLWFFRNGCPACSQNLQNWKDLYAENSRTNRYNIIAISTDSSHVAQKYKLENQLPYEVYTLKDKKIVGEKYKIVGVPLTMIIGTDGKVKEAYIGVLKAEDKGKLLATK